MPFQFRYVVLASSLLGSIGSGLAQEQAERPPKQSKAPAAVSSAALPRRFLEFPVADAPTLDVASTTAKAVAVLLALAEGEDRDQWPYEGVYREDRGQLPVGYKVGGTAIACLGLLGAPGYARDAERQAAVARGLRFVLETLDAPRMQIAFQGTYDVRGWGHIYALELLLHLQDHRLVPGPLVAAVETRAQWLVQALVESAIPEAGGWNYSRPRGYRSPKNRASTFMTPAALQALFHAKARGHEVPAAVVTQALDALERARSKPGGYAYGAPAKSQNDVDEAALTMMDRTPSSAARAAACEAVLQLAGRGDAARLRESIERFFRHWDDLAVRKSQDGTHVEPYGIAPYYFMYGHFYVAQAIELVADVEQRNELRMRMRTTLAKSREDDGSWNDRQFGRSAGYGTALAVLVLHMEKLPKLVPWAAPAAK
ncbi:MAG: hypothetical protein JNK49_07305 [Planctomycetes bacterium]|nr:hypothetical protein [Planctomycetota bacterium]